MARREHFFHGTSSDLEDSGMVLPPKVSGAGSLNRPISRMYGPRPEGYGNYDHASVSEKSRSAWEFAEMTAKKTNTRSRVYVTGRAADMRMGIEHARNPEYRGGASQEWISKTGYPITGREDVRPPERWERKTGRQGTLPMDFHKLEYEYNGDIYALGDNRGNHPSMVEQRAEAERARLQGKKRSAEQASPDSPLPKPKRRGRQQRLF